MMHHYNKRTLTHGDLQRMRVSLASQPTALRSEPSCDFCGGLNPVCVYAASRMSTGHHIRAWRWCACQSCSQAIDVDNWTAIEEAILARLKRFFPKITSEEHMREAISKALLEFHRYAEKRP